jgi:hypothetical protein
MRALPSPASATACLARNLSRPRRCIHPPCRFRGALRPLRRPSARCCWPGTSKSPLASVIPPFCDFAERRSGRSRRPFLLELREADPALHQFANWGAAQSRLPPTCATAQHRFADRVSRVPALRFWTRAIIVKSFAGHPVLGSPVGISGAKIPSARRCHG